MKSELEKRLYKQIHLQSWIVVSMSIYIVGSIMNSYGKDESAIKLIGSIMGLAAIIATLVVWILGIINATKINKITGNSTLLIVFSAITLWFGGLIVAVLEKNKYKNKNYLVTTNDVNPDHGTNNNN